MNNKLLYFIVNIKVTFKKCSLLLTTVLQHGGVTGRKKIQPGGFREEVLCEIARTIFNET